MSRRTAAGFEPRREESKPLLSLELKAFLIIMGLLLTALVVFELFSKV